jgi:hypothetical protein
VAEQAGHITPDHILQIGFGFWASKTLLSAVELGVFSELAKGAQSGGELRQNLGLHERSARDFFDALVALGLLQRDGDRYSNTPETDLFLDRAKRSYVGGILEMANDRLYPFWALLTQGLKSGQPQSLDREGDTTTGAAAFDILYQDEGRLRQFAQSMTGISMGAAIAIAHKFPWDRYKSFVDVGAAEGGTPVQIALAHPHLTGIGVDLAGIEPVFNAYVAANGLSDRLRFQAGDIFAEPLPKADVVLLGHMLHGWDLNEKRSMLSRAYEALPEGGAVVVYEAIIDDERRQNAFGLLMSLNMLIETPGGFDFTGADCQGWMREAGFRDTYLEHLVGPDSMVVGFK